MVIMHTISFTMVMVRRNMQMVGYFAELSVGSSRGCTPSCHCASWLLHHWDYAIIAAAACHQSTGI